MPKTKKGVGVFEEGQRGWAS